MEGADGVAVCRALRRAAMIWAPPRPLQHPERHSLERTLDQLDISQRPHDIAHVVAKRSDATLAYRP